MQERCGFDPWVGKIPWKRKMVTHFSFFLGSPMDRGDWWAIVHGGCKELDVYTKTGPGIPAGTVSDAGGAAA